MLPRLTTLAFLALVFAVVAETVDAGIIVSTTEIVGPSGSLLPPDSALNGNGYRAFQVNLNTDDGDLITALDVRFDGPLHQRWTDIDFDTFADPTPTGAPSDMEGDSHLTLVPGALIGSAPFEDNNSHPTFSSPLPDDSIYDYGIGTTMSGAWGVPGASQATSTTVGYLVMPPESQVNLQWDVSTSDGRFTGATPIANPGPPPLEVMGYLATRTSNSVVHAINLDTGDSTPFGPSGVANVRALEYVNGVLYAAGDGGLYTIDTTTGVGSPVGNSPVIDDLAATSAGALFANSATANEQQLLSVDPATGNAVAIGSMSPFVSTNGIAIDREGTAIGWDDGAEWLFEIDLSDASATSIGPLNDAFFQALDYGPDGTLYGWTGSEVRSIDVGGLTSTSTQNFSIPAFSFTLITDPTPFWNKSGPGVFLFDDAANWTPTGAPTAQQNANFVLDGDVDIVLGTASVADSVVVSDGKITFVSSGNGSLQASTSVTIDDPLATGFPAGADVTLVGTNGAELNAGTALNIGLAGYGKLLVRLGANVTSQHISVGDGASGNGLLFLTGADTTVQATAQDVAIAIGASGGTGIVTTQNGAELSTSSTGQIVIGSGLGADGTMTVSDAQTLVSTLDLMVGAGGDGELTVSNGGRVDQTVLGPGVAEVALDDTLTNAGSGNVQVTGQGSSWLVDQAVFGVTGIATISIDSGGSIAALSNVTIGSQSTGTGTVTVSGSGPSSNSLLDVGQDLYIGAAGTGIIGIEQGGEASVGNDLYIATDVGNANANSVSVTGAASILDVSQRLEVGRNGVGSLAVSNGGSVDATNLTAGELPNSSGTISVAGPVSAITASATGIATQGDGSLSVTSGGTFQTERLWVGFLGASDGSVVVDGQGSTLTVGGRPSQQGMLFLGGSKNHAGGLGSITISGGGNLVAIDEATIGPNPTSKGSLTVTGAASLADFTEINASQETLYVGDEGMGTMSVLQGGQVRSELAILGESAGASGTVTVAHTNSRWETGGLIVGNNGVGSLEIVDGGQVDTFLDVSLASQSGSVATATIGSASGTAARWDVDGALFVGGGSASNGGNATVTIETNGTVAVGGQVRIWDVGAVEINGGELSLRNLTRSAGSQFDFVQGTLSFANNAANNRILDASALQDIFNGNAVIAAGQRLEYRGPITLNAPIVLEGGEFSLAAVTPGTENSFRSNLDWDSGTLEISDSDFHVSNSGQLGNTVNLTPGQVLVVGGSLENDGQFTVLGTSASFAMASTVHAAGRLNAINANLTFSNGLTNEGDLLVVDSTFQGDVENGGGSMLLNGSNVFGDDLTLGPGDFLFIDLGGTSPGEFDVLTVMGDVELGGILQLATVGGFTPLAGDEFVIVDAMGLATGTFAGLVEGAKIGNFGGTTLHITYSGGDGNDVAAVARLFESDFDFDGDVDANDFAIWESAYGANALADADGDGDTRGSDFLTWQRQNGSGVANVADSAAVVPEPESWLAFLISCASLAAACRSESGRRAAAL